MNALLLACALAMVSVLAPSAQAAVRDYYFTRVGTDRGLTQNTITALVQDTQGFVWVGTQGGLHRYDGQRYVPYRNDPRDPASLPDSFVTALALEGDRALWVGSYSQYLSRLDLASGRIERFVANADQSTGQAGRQIAAVLPRDGKVWVGTMAGLERFDPRTGQREQVIPLEPHRLRGLPTQQLLGDGSGNLWYANAIGLFKVGPDGHAQMVGEPAVTSSLLLDAQQRLWIGRRDGLFRLDTGDTLRKVWPLEDSRVTAARTDVRALVQAPDGNLWFSVFGDGLRRFDANDGGMRRIAQATTSGTGMPENAITSLMLDRGGMLWVGAMWRGVAITDPRGARFHYIFELDNRHTDALASSDSVRSVHEGGNGTLWIGTDQERLLRYELAGDRFEDWTDRLAAAAGHPVGRVKAIADTGDGRLWLATSNGLLRLSPASGVVEPIDLGRFSDVNLDSLLVDRHGNLWLGTADKGALYYRPGSGELSLDYSHDNGVRGRLSHPRVLALLEDRRGRIWFGTGDGIDLLDPASGVLGHFRNDPNRVRSLPGNLVRALSQSADGTVWIGSHAGLSRAVDRADGGLDFIQPLAEAPDAPPSLTVFTIAASPAVPGQLWLGTDAGVVRLDIATGQARTYGLADGLQDLEFNGGAATTLADGRIAMGGVRGLNVFDPVRIRASGYQAPLRLLSARIGAEVPTRGGVLWQPMRLEIPDGADILRLRIGALDYAPTANIRYRYRMDGFDKGWIENGSQPTITYTRLPPGGYLFRAQATDRDGAWNPQELRIPVEVAPPLWRHPLTISVLLIALLSLLAVLGWHWRRRRQHEQDWLRQLRERDEHLKLALWASGEQFWDYDLDRHVMHRMWVPDMGGNHLEITVERHFSSELVIHDDDLPRVKAIMGRHLRGESALFMSEHRARKPGDSEWRWVRSRGRVVERDSGGRGLRIAGTARDITDSRSAEHERRISSEVLRSMAEAVAVFDRDFIFISVNPAFCRMTGYAENEVVGQSTKLLDSIRHDSGFHVQMRTELQRDGQWAGEMWQQRKDGNEFLCWLQASAVKESDGQRSHYVAVLSDITDQKRAEQELRYLANYDPLTGLPNRTLLLERLSAAIVRARANRSRIAVLFLDLDRFKDINDSLGHAAGDRILRAAANRLQHIVGAGHTVARLGGDEFMVVLEDIGDVQRASEVSARLIAAFEAPLEFDQRHDVVISPSIGISLYPDDAQVPSDLIKHADTAMYQAKAIGRRAFMHYVDAMDAEVQRRATLSAALRKVLDRGELSLVFQPRLSLADDRISGVEALLRWHSAEHGHIPPAQFIPLAEETGVILEIGEWALREACRMLEGWRASGLTELSMAVNVSSLQLQRGDLPGVIARILDESGIPAQRLELELTESVLMADPARTAETLQAFRQLGVNLAIDDFGTGYSSLSYLKRLPITMLKVDKEFIDDLTHDPDDAAIVSTVIAMGHSLGLTVVAEGVETQEQVDILRNIGCDEIQGYWLATPLPAERLQAFLHAHAAGTRTTGPSAG